jgi:hypothetical protein
MGDAIGNDAGLAGARARQDQNRPLQRFDGLTLLRIQNTQIQHGARILIFNRRKAIFFVASHSSSIFPPCR